MTYFYTIELNAIEKALTLVSDHILRLQEKANKRNDKPTVLLVDRIHEKLNAAREHLSGLKATTVVLALLLFVAQAQALSKAAAKDLVRSAHTVSQYQQLASYFHEQEVTFRIEAAVEKRELDRRAQVNAGLMQKYPRPVDSAQYWYTSYVSQADAAAALTQHYIQLSGK